MYEKRYIDFQKRIIQYFIDGKLVREAVLPDFFPLIPGYAPVKKNGDNLPITKLIKLTESQLLEFKSSLSWDVERDEYNQFLLNAPPRAIAALMNSDGGTLLIGVEDNRNIYGIEKDMANMQGDTTTFETRLHKLFKNRLYPLNDEFYNVRFEKINGKTVCAVDVEKAPAPIMMKWNSEERFFVRFGNFTQTLRTNNIDKYIKCHWV